MDRDIDHEETARLMAALYGDEGEGSDADATGAASPDGKRRDDLQGELAAELESYRQLRSLFAALPDHEPPAAVTAKLLAAASRAAVPAAEAGPSFLQRVLGWFEPLRAHPALAAVASLALVATIGGVLFLGGKAQLAEPSVSSSSPDSGTATPMASGPEPTAPDRDQREPGPAPAAIGVAVPEPADESASESELQQGDRQLSRGEKRRRNPARNRAKSTAADSAAKRAATSKANTEETIDLRSAKESESKKTGRQPSGLGADRSEDTDKTDDTDGVGENAPVVVDGASGAGSKTGSTQATEPPPPAKAADELRKLRSRARSLAKKGNCAMVTKLGEQVKEIDSGYFSRSFVSDKTIARCFRAKK